MPKVIPNKFAKNQALWGINRDGWVTIETNHPTKPIVYIYILDRDCNPRRKLPALDKMHPKLNELARKPGNLTFPGDGTAPFFIFRICDVEKKVWVNQNLMPSFTQPDSFFTNQFEFEAAAKAAFEVAS